MPELIKYTVSELQPLYDTIVESFTSALLDVYPELLSGLCDVIRSSENV